MPDGLKPEAMAAKIRAAVAARDLCTLADVVRYAPGYTAGDDADTDATLTTLITAISREVHRAAGREFVAINPVVPDRRFPLDQAALRLADVRIGDCTTVTALELQDENGATLQTFTADQIIALPLVREEWEPIQQIRMPPGVAMVAWPLYYPRWIAPARPAIGGYLQVSGTWGFPSLPEDIVQAAARLVLLRYLNDVAAEGTAFAEAVNQAGLNLASLFRSAADVVASYHNDPVA